MQLNILVAKSSTVMSFQISILFNWNEVFRHFYEFQHTNTRSILMVGFFQRSYQPDYDLLVPFERLK